MSPLKKPIGLQDCKTYRGVNPPGWWRCDLCGGLWAPVEPINCKRQLSFASLLDVPPEIAEELDRVFGEVGAREDDIHRKHKPPFGADMVVLPKHYARFEIEPIHFICTNKLDFFQANIIKYTCRAEHKHGDNGLEDCMKVLRYGIMRAKFLQGDPDWWRPYRNPGLHAALLEEVTCGPVQGPANA